MSEIDITAIIETRIATKVRVLNTLTSADAIKSAI